MSAAVINAEAIRRQLFIQFDEMRSRVSLSAKEVRLGFHAEYGACGKKLLSAPENFDFVSFGIHFHEVDRPDGTVRDEAIESTNGDRLPCFIDGIRSVACNKRGRGRIVAIKLERAEAVFVSNAEIEIMYPFRILVRLDQRADALFVKRIKPPCMKMIAEM